MINVVLLGTVEFSLAMLKVLKGTDEVRVQAVFQVDEEHSKGISDWADLAPTCMTRDIEHVAGAKVCTPENTSRIYALNPDLLLVMGLPEIIPPELLELPTVGSHPSILPKNRGHAAIPWQILNHERRGAVTFFRMVDRVDAGPILFQGMFDISPMATARTVYDSVIRAGKETMRSLVWYVGEWGELPKGVLQEDSEATYLPRRTDADGRIDWRAPAMEIHDLVRATTHPYPGAFTFLNGPKIRVWEASAWVGDPISGTAGRITGVCTGGGVGISTHDGGVNLIRVSEDGGPEMTAFEFLQTRMTSHGLACEMLGARFS